MEHTYLSLGQESFVLSAINYHSLFAEQLNVKCAFLNRNLKEKLYMKKTIDKF